MQIHSFWFQTQTPRGGGLGAVEPGWYFVQDGTLTMCNEAGHPTGKTHALAAGEDARQIAGRLARSAWSAEQDAAKAWFNGPIHYGPTGVA